MVHKQFHRLLAVLLAVVLLTVPASAEPLEQMAVERQVYTFLTEELGLTTAAACGVLANIEHESAFRPTIVGDQGTSYGLCQWHNERFSTLRGYCSALGLDYRTVDGQLAYLKYELGNRYTTLLLTLQSIDNTPDGAYRAAYLWCIQFEKPSNMQAKAVARGELAQGKYWVRYNRFSSIIMVEPEAKPEPNPETLIEQLKQNPVAIPLPPEEKRENQGNTHYFRFEKPEFIYYIPRNLPKSDQAASIPVQTLPAEPIPAASRGLRWEIPALAAIGAAMVIVVLFPSKKRSASLYRQGKYMVK